jgi:enoyl-CoA hydratase
MIEVESKGPVGIVTLARPATRNALTGAMLRDLHASMRELDDNAEIRAIVITGADPAFCSGLDLKDLAATYSDIRLASETDVAQRGLLPITATPVIGAINGPAVTGGLEVALGCDWMIASRQHATFADTHARVGVMPGAGLTIRLPQLIGINRARQMSFTGNFIDATTAYEWGLVNEICDHEQLLARAVAMALSVAEADPAAVRELRSMYELLSHRGDDEAYREESRWSRRWMKERFDPGTFATHRDSIIALGSSQQDPTL